MPRIRSIKPEFFVNDELASLGMDAQLFFIGLWCHADREGRLSDRPKRLKIAILPYADVDADDVLERLHGAGFIHRYEVDGERYIQVVNFHKHQYPNAKESASTIPAPCGHDASTPLIGKGMVNGEGAVNGKGAVAPLPKSSNAPKCLSDAERDGLLMALPGTDMLPPWTHVLRAIERQRKSAVSPSDISVIVGALNECCPTCTEPNPTRCAADVVGKIDRAKTLANAARFIRQDLRGA